MHFLLPRMKSTAKKDRDQVKADLPLEAVAVPLTTASRLNPLSSTWKSALPRMISSTTRWQEIPVAAGSREIDVAKMSLRATARDVNAPQLASRRWFGTVGEHTGIGDP
jgi:hypothetical protein